MISDLLHCFDRNWKVTRLIDFNEVRFYCIDKTLQSVGFKTLPMHNQVLTLGEWGWVLAKKKTITKEMLSNIDVSNVPLRWFNNEAIPQITSFGKPLVDTTGIKMNTIFEPVLYTYYKQGNWDL